MIPRLALILLLGTVLPGLSPAFAAAPATAEKAGDSPKGTVPIPVPAPVTEVTPMPKPATPANPVQIVPPSAGTPAVGSLMQTLFALAVVLGVLALLAWLLKRYGPRPQAGAGNLHIVGALNLGGRERIIVVEIGGQWIVVGASPGRVNALATMPRQEGVAGPATLDSNAPAMPNFAQWLKQTIDKRNAK